VTWDPVRRDNKPLRSYAQLYEIAQAALRDQRLRNADAARVADPGELYSQGKNECNYIVIT
jgi:hypothetical protein